MARENDPIPFATDKVPLYYQIGTLLRAQILSGRYDPGDKLPTEAEFVSRFGVSRITVRQALRSIEEEGLIRREAGRGTFVTEAAADAAEGSQLKGSLDELLASSPATSVRLLDLRPVTASRADRETFALAEDAKVMHCTRVRYHDERPYGYLVSRLPVEIAERLSRRDWERSTVFRVLEKNGLVLGDADQTVRATLADAFLAGILQTRVGAAILAVDRIVRTIRGRAVEQVHAAYRGDVYRLDVQLARTRGRSADRWTLKTR